MKWNDIYDQLKEEMETKGGQVVSFNGPAVHEVQSKFLEIAFSASEDLMKYTRCG